MFCSGCGQVLEPWQPFCPKCGRPVAPSVPPVPGLQFQLESYAGKVKILSIFWFVYAGLSLVLGFAGLAFLRAIFSGGFGPWMNDSMMPMWLGSVVLRFAWLFLALRTGLALAAGWGLWERTQWGRIVAIVASVFSLLKFPIGTAMGVWTMVVLLGDRNSIMYEQL
jgi:hypothetical protein